MPIPTIHPCPVSETGRLPNERATGFAARRRRPSVAGLVLAALLSCPPVHGEIVQFTVTTTLDLADSDPGDGECSAAIGLCSLRAAIQELNQVTDPSLLRQIDLPPGTYPLTRQGFGSDTPAVGDLDLQQPIRILVDDGGTAVVDAQGIDRAFEIDHPSQSNFNTWSWMLGLQIVGGTATKGGGVYLSSAGGGLRLERSAVRDNSAQQGGGIFSEAGGEVWLIRTTVEENSALLSGGGGVFAELTTIESTVARNSAPTGSAFVVHESASANNSTFSGNSGAPAALYVEDSATLVLRNATVVEAPVAIQTGAGVTFSVRDSLIVGGCTGPTGVTIDAGGSLESPGSSCGLSPLENLIGVGDPGVRPLAVYGGPTETHALRESSPARDIGILCELDIDQRSAPRDDPFCDAGSLEYGAVVPGSRLFGDGFESGTVEAWSGTAP